MFHYVTSLEIALLYKKKGSGTGKGINDVYILPWDNVWGSKVNMLSPLVLCEFISTFRM